MSLQTVTFGVPTGLYDQLKQRAEQSSRTVEAELVDVLAAVVPEHLPDDLAEAIAPLSLLDDAALQRAARSRLPDDLAEQLETLHLKQQREGLTDAETEQVAALVRQYERAMLVRSRAAALLKERGQDTSPLIAP